MATEGPLIHDGSQMTASADLSGATTQYSGPNNSAQFLFVAISGSRTVTLDISATGAPYGVLQNTPASGQAADVGIQGITKMVAGAAIAAGAELMKNSTGQAIAWVSGSANRKVGQALETVTASGQVFTARLYDNGYAATT